VINGFKDCVVYRDLDRRVPKSHSFFFVYIILTCFSLTPLTAASQAARFDGLAGQPTDHIQLAYLKTGLSVAEVARALGEPDRKGGAGGPGVESWYYGESMVLFADGKVSAWSDHGELSEREEMHQFDSSDSTASAPVEYHGWENAWTAEKLPDAAELLDTIIQE
jgi:hypothetical protein